MNHAAITQQVGKNCRLQSTAVGGAVVTRTRAGTTRNPRIPGRVAMAMARQPTGEIVLYQTTPQSITLHLKALYADGEIE